MHRTLAILSSLAAVVSAIGAAGCSSSSPSPAASCQPNANVSFKTDVIPVFQTSCTISSVCHGQMNNVAEESLYLGENMGTTDPNAVYSQIVGVKAKELPTMNLVTAGDINNSFLWQKIQTTASLAMLDSQCAMATMNMAKCTDCTAGMDCGSTMPYLNTDLSEASPDLTCTIKNWIENGALNN